MSIRINRIVVKKLFNKFNYDLNLDNGYDLSILIAPNGCGKTTIFNVLNFILKPSLDRFEKIKNIPFNVFVCYLSNGAVLKLKTDKDGLSFCIDSIDKYDDYKTIVINSETIQILQDDSQSNSNVNAKQRKPITNFKKSFENLLKDVHVSYITSNRLFAENSSGETHDSALQKNKKIQIEFKDVYDKYNDLQSKAKDTIVNRFLNDSSCQTTEDIETSWTKYITSVKGFSSLGLIDSSYNISKKMIKQAESDKTKSSFMNIYIEEFSKTLDPVKDFYKRLKLFTDILNERNKITGKSFSFSKDDGVKLNVDGKRLDLDCMSSGEKNDFVMFYNLIFDSRNGGIVLIDEPEISLHIEWQETLLDKMQDICRLNNLQAIIATHSPHIINGHFDLILEGGPTK